MYKRDKINMQIFRKLQAETVSTESDKLIRARDMSETLDLKESIDEDDLDRFWSQVEEDIQKDPDWFKFNQ